MSQLGQHVNTTQLNKFLEHIFNRNNKLHEKGQRGTPIMIWGNHGLGKTHTVVEFAKKNNWKMAYCAPSQFEEWIRELGDKVDRAQIELWAKHVAKGKITEEEFGEKAKGM